MYANEIYQTATEAMAKPVFDAGILMDWDIDPAADHCDQCPGLAEGGPYSDPDNPVDGADPLPTYPGNTDCFSNCKCQLVFEQASWDAYSTAQGFDQS
jgi:hypothetical protein